MNLTQIDAAADEIVAGIIFSRRKKENIGIYFFDVKQPNSFKTYAKYQGMNYEKLSKELKTISFQTAYLSKYLSPGIAFLRRLITVVIWTYSGGKV